MRRRQHLADSAQGYSIDWLPDGRLLTTGDKVRRREPGGSIAVHAEQRASEIVVDARANPAFSGQNPAVSLGARPPRDKLG